MGWESEDKECASYSAFKQCAFQRMSTKKLGCYMCLINVKNGLLLFCVILLISFCLFPVKYISRAAAILLGAKNSVSFPVSCVALCIILRHKTPQRYSSVTAFTLYVLTGPGIQKCAYTHGGGCIHTHMCILL